MIPEALSMLGAMEDNHLLRGWFSSIERINHARGYKRVSAAMNEEHRLMALGNLLQR
jgi:hypothetical protein